MGVVFINLYSTASRAGRSLYPAAAARAPGPRRGARPRSRPTPAAGTCCARPPGRRRGAAAPLSSSPVSAGRRSSRRRRQLPGRGSPAERGLQRPGAWRLPAAATREAGSGGRRDVPGHFLTGWQARAARLARPGPPWWLGGPLCVGRGAVEAREGAAAGDELTAAKYAAHGPREAARSRFSPSRRPALGFEIMYVRVAVLPLSAQRASCAPGRGAPARPRRAPTSPLPVPSGGTLALTAGHLTPRPLLVRRSIHIVALGNEGDAFHQDNRPSGLIRTYLGRSPLVSGDESSLLLNAASTVARPVFTEYQASAFGNVKLVVHDCPVWVRGGGRSVPALTELSFFYPPTQPPSFHFLPLLEYGSTGSLG